MRQHVLGRVLITGRLCRHRDSIWNRVCENKIVIAVIIIIITIIIFMVVVIITIAFIIVTVIVIVVIVVVGERPISLGVLTNDTFDAGFRIRMVTRVTQPHI